MNAVPVRSSAEESFWRVFRHGILAGTLGYSAIALFYVAFNALTGRPILGTAAALGSTLLNRQVAGDALVDPAPIFVFNGFHLGVFLIIGLVAAWFVSESERHPVLWYLVSCLGLFVFFHLWGLTLTFARDVAAFIPQWTILLSSSLAVLAMAAYFWFIDPNLRRAVKADLEDTSD